MPQLACIIPVVGSTAGLETTLLSVLERRPDDCEILVVTNIAYDDPYHLQGEIQILQAPPSAGLVQCINLGIQTARAPIVHVLANGMQACDGWIDLAMEHFQDPLIAAVTPLIYDANDQQHLLAAGIGYRPISGKFVSREIASESKSADASVGPLLQAAFYRKAALDPFGGLPTAVGDDLADVDLAMSLRHAGWQMRIEPSSRVLLASSLEAASPHGAMVSGFWSERLFWRQITAANWTTRLLHPFVALMNILLTKPLWKAPAQAVGRLFAVSQLGHYRQHQQQLQFCIDSRIALTMPSVNPAQPTEQKQNVQKQSEQKPKQPAGTIQRVDAAHPPIAKPETNRQSARRSQKQKK